MSERLAFEREIEILTRPSYEVPTKPENFVGLPVNFPSGESLSVVTGPDGPGEEYYDPNNSGNPLLYTGVPHRSKKLSKSFTVDDLARSGNKKFYKARIDPKLVQCLQAIRDYLNKPVIITSGYRSYKYNKEIYKQRGLKPTKSQHLSGRAADIKISDMTGVDIAKAAIDACGCNISIGLGHAFAHIDIRGKFNVWDYGGVSKENLEDIRRYYRERCRKLVVLAEWEGEISRNGPDYIRWVQQSLNKIAGMNLALDGIEGPKTRKAISSFQQKRGLVADGIIGPNTERALLAAGAHSPPVTPAPSPLDTNKHLILGLDTASVAENRNPNWVQAKIEGSISFTIIRSNWGDTDDRVFKRNWPKIKDAGIVRGAYLFLRFPHPKYGMKAPDPVSQANALIKMVGRDWAKSDFPPTIDVEFPGMGGRKLTGMTAQHCLDNISAAWKTLKNYYGVAPIIYTSARVWKEDLDNLRATELVESPLWLARYPFKKGPAIRDVRVSRLKPPPVPPPWGDSTNWWIHQYQGDAVNLPGFPTGNVDMNRFNIMVKGEIGDRVKWAQRRLGIAQNGQFDETMESALRAFQNRKGLPMDGMIGVQTFAYLCWSNP